MRRSRRYTAVLSIWGVIVFKAYAHCGAGGGGVCCDGSERRIVEQCARHIPKLKSFEGIGEASSSPSSQNWNNSIQRLLPCLRSSVRARARVCVCVCVCVCALCAAIDRLDYWLALKAFASTTNSHNSLMYKDKMTQMSHFDSFYTSKKMWVILRASRSHSKNWRDARSVLAKGTLRNNHLKLLWMELKGAGK